MAIFLADRFDIQLSFYSHIIDHQLAMFFMDLHPMHRTDLFIKNGVDLEYTKKNFLKFHGE